MPKVTVPLRERAYDIIIQNGALEQLLATVELAPGAPVAVFSNATVAPLYAEKLATQLRARGLQVLCFNAPDGEAYKNLDWTARAYDALAEARFTRRGVIFAVGGGVVGDWTGFVAATWMRGVDFVQVPTTLLAMVDSSVGGKTGVNHPQAKNLIGAFHQPRAVLIDPQTLSTLPARELHAGLAEVIKYGVIADGEFFAWLETHLDEVLALENTAIEKVITRSCQLKAEVVGADERESDASGRRATLNYGHTVGHAIEATTAYGKYLHGEAIAIGMTVAAHLAHALKTIAPDAGHDLMTRQTRLLQRAGLPVGVPPECDFDALWAAMKLDKKARAGGVNFLLPTRIGHVAPVNDVPRESVRDAIETLRQRAD